MNMKRQKNYRQLRSKSSARNKLNEIKSRSVITDTRHSDTTVNAVNKDLFGEYAENPAYGEPPEDRFDNTPLPDFQFDRDEEFFGTALPENNSLTETKPFESQTTEKETFITVSEEVKQDSDSVIQEDVTAINITESVEPTPAATVETEPETEKPKVITSAPARFVSVKRRMAEEKHGAEKIRKQETTKQAVNKNTVVKKADSPARKKVGSMTYGLPPKFGQCTAIYNVERTVASIQKPATGNSVTEKKREVPSLNVRHASSFRSFVISTIQRLLEQQRFLALERESSTFLPLGPGTGKREETATNDTSALEKSQAGTTRWNNPLITAASTGLAHKAGAKGQKSNRVPGEKQPVTRSSLARGKSKPAPGSYELNAARITLMEARINAKAISGNMKMKW
jgi:hypothetical protein